MSAVVHDAGGSNVARFYAECDYCGWTSPTGGFVTEAAAEVRAADHNEAAHPLAEPDDDDHLARPALGRTHPYGGSA